MITLNRRTIILIVVGVLVLAAVAYGFWPSPISVETAIVERDSLEVVVEEEGQTEVVDRYVVSAPVTAMARRLTVEAGDAVEEGEPVVELEAPRASILDGRTRAEASTGARERRPRRAPRAQKPPWSRPSGRWTPPRPCLSAPRRSAAAWSASTSRAPPRAEI